jgi:serine/threonine-protein kinase RIO1
VVIPEANPNAFRIFQRDVTRICDYFFTQGIVSYPHRLAEQLWKAYGHRVRQDVHPACLDPEDPKDYQLWKSQVGS